MRTLVRRLDALLRRRAGVYEFTSNPECILRIAVSRAPRDLRLPDIEVRAGEPILALHLWNERLPLIPAAGPDLAWAVRLVRPFVRSLHLVAAEMQADPRLAGLRAVGAATGVIAPGEQSSGASVMRRLGFEVVPYRGRLGRFGEFWQNFYSWWIMWTYNAASIRDHRILQLRRCEIWVSTAAFLRRYASAPAPSAEPPPAMGAG